MMIRSRYIYALFHEKLIIWLFECLMLCPALIVEKNIIFIHLVSLTHSVCDFGRWWVLKEMKK